MGRELRRVPLDFKWPLDKVWTGFLMPEHLHEGKCEECDGSGYSKRGRELREQWYGYAPFNPRETKSRHYTMGQPAIRAIAKRNVGLSPEFYGPGPEAVNSEARRLAALFNSRWQHHLAQADVDALIADGRLREFTHAWTCETGWAKKDPAPEVRARDVNMWSLSGFGHDSINSWVAIKAKCERGGATPECSVCEGHGCVEKFPGQRAEAEAWERTEPPAGDGWQMWETVSEGSPITPAFPTADALIDHLVNVGAWDKKWSREAAESFVNGSGWAPSLMVTDGHIDTPETWVQNA